MEDWKNIRQPRDLALERSILSDLLHFEESIAVTDAAITHKDFYLRDHQLIYWAIKNRPNDYPDVILKKIGADKKGYFILGVLQEPVPGSLTEACKKLRQISVLRREILETAQRLYKLVEEGRNHGFG